MRVFHFFIFCFCLLLMFALGYKQANAQSFFKSVHLVETPTTQATAGGTTNLTLASQTVQRFTGSANQTVALPNATTLSLGMYYLIANDSTGTLTVNDGSGSGLSTVLSTNSASFRLIANSNAAGVWSIENNYTATPATTISGIVPLINGGTGQANVASQGGIAYGTASGISLTAASTSGQVWISQGTAAPVTYNAQVGALFYGGTSGVVSQNANYLFWDASNERLSVGVNASTSNSFTVNGVTKGSVFTVEAQGGTNEYEMAVRKNSATLWPQIAQLRSRGSGASPSVVQNGDILSQMDFLGYDGTDYEYGAKIDVVVDGAPGNNDMPSAIRFWTVPDGTANPVLAASISQDRTFSIYGTLDTALTVSGVVTTNTAGVISSEAQLALSRGGTANNISAIAGGAIYSTASALSVTAAGVSGQVLTSQGSAAPIWKAFSVNASDVAGIISLGQGGTNTAITASQGALAYGTSNGISLTAAGVSGQTIISQGSSAPIWGNGVISSASNQRIETARFTTTTGPNACSITSEKGDWVTGTPSSALAGQCSFTIITGIFSDTPNCVFTVVSSTLGISVIGQASSSTAANFQIYDAAGAGTAGVVTASCVGTR